ncbi:ion transporter [Streptomyces sp. NPDC046887]|uniref:ion transporter n=1 Tax=Streptomyces sp. NPDC046887 TaxID=3155472 RepID=UPI0033C8E8A2
MPAAATAVHPVRLTLARRARTVTEDRRFAFTMIGVILANAVLLGLETYPGLVHSWGRWLHLAEHLCLAAFTVEMLLRLSAHADDPRAFLRDPWNLFDLAVVASAFLPTVRDNTTLLRLLRLARVLRTARFLPQLRLLMVAVGRSLPGTVSFLLLGGLVLYVYAMVGWVAFGEEDPRQYGSAGRALLTLFLLMTLDGIGEVVRAGLEISPWSVLYYASYVLIASFVLVNMLIGVVISSMEEARELEREERAAGVVGGGADGDELAARIATARQALGALETALAATAATTGRRPGPIPAYGPPPEQAQAAS